MNLVFYGKKGQQIIMKKVSGYVSVRALGCYDFEFYVDDNATDEEIQQKVDEYMQLSHDYSVEELIVNE